MSKSLGNKPVSRLASSVFVLALATLVAACGSGGGGGGGLSITTDVLVEDAPIIGAIVQDSSPTPQTAGPESDGEGQPTGRPGRYRFGSPPVLPIKIISPNIVSSDGKVKIAFVNGQWVSYLDTDNSNTYTPGETTKPLAFQDLDGNGIFTQTADLAYNGRFNVNYVPTGASVLRANIVAGLLPRDWNGTSSVGGLSPSVLKKAVDLGIQASDDMTVKKVAALLTAVSEALLSSDLAASTALPTLLENVAASTALSSTATPSQLAAEAVKVLATDTQDFGRALGTNLKTVADNVSITSNFESLVKLAINPDNTSTLKQATLSEADLTTLTTLVSNGSKQITEDQKVASAAGAVDPEVATIAAMRLVPWHELSRIESGVALDNTVPFRSVGFTTGFAIAKTATGALTLRASGSPFTEALGSGTPFTIPFVSTGANWQLFPSTNNGVVVDIKSGFQLPGTTTYVPGAMLRVCQANSGGCWPFMLASPTQVCALLNSGTFRTNADRRQTALSAINAINSAQSAVVCP